MRFVLLTILFISAFAHARDLECERQLYLADGEKTSKFVFGQTSHLNASLLRNYQDIEPSVLRRFNLEAASLTKVTRTESHQLALTYHQNPSQRNREKLFKAVQVLSLIASRHLLARMKNVEDFEDYLQSGYAAIWSGLPYIPKLQDEKINSIFYWDGITNGLRKRAFAEMRAMFRTQYSLTPVDFNSTSTFTFDEELLLFGDSPEMRATIAKKYGHTVEGAEREWNLQQESDLINLQPATEALDPDENNARIESGLEQADLRQLLNGKLQRLKPREEFAIRAHIQNDQTYDDIGLRFGVTRERVRQIEATGLRRLKHPFNSKDLVPYRLYPEHRQPVEPRIYSSPMVRARVTPDEDKRRVLIEKENSQRRILLAPYLSARKAESLEAQEMMNFWKFFGNTRQMGEARIWLQEFIFNENTDRLLTKEKELDARSLESDQLEARLLQNRYALLERARQAQARAEANEDMMAKARKELQQLRSVVEARTERMEKEIREKRAAIRAINDREDNDGLPDESFREARSKLYRELSETEEKMETSKARDLSTARIILLTIQEQVTHP